jgi:hypothetical protein
MLVGNFFCDGDLGLEPRNPRADAVRGAALIWALTASMV